MACMDLQEQHDSFIYNDDFLEEITHSQLTVFYIAWF
jgi:hypothetical protein